jgi:hypothetical protein
MGAHPDSAQCFDLAQFRMALAQAIGGHLFGQLNHRNGLFNALGGGQTPQDSDLLQIELGHCASDLDLAQRFVAFRRIRHVIITSTAIIRPLVQPAKRERYDPFASGDANSTWWTRE